jgi:uncharacterized protein YdaU (DUF1376 family)
MNYYPFHIGDFRSGTVNMSRQARWIYRDMLDFYYDAEKPLPLDIDVLCHEIGIESEEETKIVERLLRFKFVKTDDGYRNEVCDRVITDYHQKAEQAKANGRLGGRPKKADANQNKPSGLAAGSEQDSIGKQPESGSQANQEPITSNQKPIKNKKTSPTASADVVEIFEHWRSVMVSPKSKLDKDRESLINKSLKLGYSVEDLKSAINGCRASPHNMGANDRSTKYNGLNVILKNADNIDRFISAEKLRGTNDQQNQFSGGQRGGSHSDRPRSAVDRIDAAIARELAERPPAAARPDPVVVGEHGSDVRPQVGIEPRDGAGQGQRMGSVFEGTFTRTA